MSKSKGGFLTVSLLEEKGYNPLVYRMFCLQSHYRKPLTFSYDNLDNTATAYNKLVKRISALSRNGEPDMAKAEELTKGFSEALDNDLNTSLALTCVYDVLKADADDATKLYVIGEFDKVLSLDLTKFPKATKRILTMFLPRKLRSLLHSVQKPVPKRIGRQPTLSVTSLKR